MRDKYDDTDGLIEDLITIGAFVLFLILMV